MKANTILIIFLCVINVAVGQTGAPCYFHGRLMLEADSTAVANALVFASSAPILRGAPTQNLSNAYTDSEGRFTLAMKDASSHFLIVRSVGDTISITLDTAPCNSIRDIFLPVYKQRTAGATYIMANVPYVLPEIKLEAYRMNQSREELPAAIGYVDSLVLTQNDKSSLLQALNTIPGVVMESRGYGGSHRLNIRGSSLRSPFAVRNVKLYLDGIPLTSADGQTPLELIDAEDVEHIEVIKGPAGSMYGSGNGGVLLVQSRNALPHEIRCTSGFQAASFGGFRWNNSASIGLKTGSLRISHNWQNYEGYRQQEFNRKQQVSLRYRQQISETQRITVFGMYYTGNWGLPGALTALQAQENPRGAVPFSIQNNAFLFRERYIASITHESEWLNYFSERTVVSYQRTSKINPYGTSPGNSGYKDEHADAITGRTEITYRQSSKNLNWQCVAGAEWQSEQYGIIEQTIFNSFPGEFKYLYDVGYLQLMGFATGEIQYKNVFNLQGGYSYTTNNQFVRGRNAAGFLFDTTATYGAVALPRIAASLQLHKGLYVFHNVSNGAANPTVFEMINQENNTYNLQLNSEKGLSRELGVKHNITGFGLNYSISIYDFLLTDAILPYTVESGPNAGIQLYDNIGSARQQGIEWMIQWDHTLMRDDLRIRLWHAGTANRYRFGNYSPDGRNYSGLSIPGVPLSQISSGVIIANASWSLNLTDYYYDRMPITNDNKVWSDAYHILNCYADYRKTLGNHWEFSVHAGINNLLNTSYTSFFSLNGFGNRFYNPAASRNSFCGIRVNYVFK